MSIKIRIKEQRSIKGWTQPQLAEQLGVTVDMVKSLEVGRAQPSVETLTKLSDIFGCTTDYLLGRTDDPKGSLDEVTMKVLQDLEDKLSIKLRDDPDVVEALKKAIIELKDKDPS